MALNSTDRPRWNVSTRAHQPKKWSIDSPISIPPLPGRRRDFSKVRSKVDCWRTNLRRLQRENTSTKAAVCTTDADKLPSLSAKVDDEVQHAPAQDILLNDIDPRPQSVTTSIPSFHEPSNKLKKNNKALVFLTAHKTLAITMLSDNKFIVAGGLGGSYKEAPNRFSTFELQDFDDQNQQCRVKQIGHHDIGDDSITNCTSHTDQDSGQIYFVAGRNESSLVYTVCSEGRDLISSYLQFQPAGASVATDSSMQNVVRVSNNGRIMATGGDDGVIRLWKFPQLSPLCEIKAHIHPCKSLDFSSDDQRIASVSSSGPAKIWNIFDGSSITLSSELNWDHVQGITNNFIRCMFTPNGQHLLAIVQPAKSSKNRLHIRTCHLIQWDASTLSVLNHVPIENSEVSALAISPCNQFIAVGMLKDYMFFSRKNYDAGQVQIFSTSNLYPVQTIRDAHKYKVLGLEFSQYAINIATFINAISIHIMHKSNPKYRSLVVVSRHRLHHPKIWIAIFTHHFKNKTQSMNKSFDPSLCIEIIFIYF